jgi:hypothetical protein
MPIELGGLAARLKAGIDAAERARREAEEAARRAAEAEAEARKEAQAARSELMEELTAFAKQVEHFEVRTRKGVLSVRFDGRSLRFAPEGEHDRIDVHADDEVHHVTRDEEGEWEVVLKEALGPRRLPLELGLEELVTRYLSVPTVEEVPNDEPHEPEPTPEPTSQPVKAQPAGPPPSPSPSATTPTDARPSQRIPAPRSKAPPGSALKELTNPWD